MARSNKPLIRCTNNATTIETKTITRYNGKMVKKKKKKRYVSGKFSFSAINKLIERNNKSIVR